MSIFPRTAGRLLAATLAFAPAAASAHAFLRSATPGVGATVRAAPAELGIDFTEAVEPRFSTITVQDAAGARVDRDDLHGDGKHLAVTLGALSPGVYRVVWHAVAVDTHRTQGSYSFTVQP